MSDTTMKDGRAEEPFVDDRTPEEKAAGRARMRAWLDTLPAPLAKVYEDLKRMDPKGQRWEQSASGGEE